MRYFIFALTYLLSFCSTHYGHGQGSKSESPETIKARGLIENAEYLWHKNPLEASLYADSAYLYYDDVADPLLRNKIVANKGIVEYIKGNYDGAIDNYLKAYHSAIRLSEDPTIYFNYYSTALLRKGQAYQVVRVIDSIQNTSMKIDSVSIFILKLHALIELGDVKKLEAEFESRPPLGSSSRYYSAFLQARGKFLTLKHKYEEAKAVFELTLSIHQAHQDSLEMATALLEMAKVEMDLGHYDSAALHIDKSKGIYLHTGYELGVANAKSALGEMYAELGQIDLSVDNYYSALKIYEKLGARKDLAVTSHELAWMYFDQDIDEALELLTRALELGRQMNNQLIEATVYNYLGVLYYEKGDYDNSLLAYKKSLWLFEKLQLQRQLATVEFNMGGLYEAKGEYDVALNYYLKTYPVDLELGNQLGAGINEYAIGHMYSLTDQYEKAREFLFKAKNRLESIEAKTDLVNCLEYIAIYYERINQTKEALKYYRKYNELKDEVYSVARESRMAELEVRYILERREQEIRLLNLENKTKQQDLQIQERTIANQRGFIALVSLGVFCFALLFLFTYRLLRIRNATNRELKKLNMEISEKAEEITAQSEELREANDAIVSLNSGLEKEVEKRTAELIKAHKELDTFFYYAAHNFRQPLTSFYGLINIAQQNVADPTALELFDKINETTISMERMANKLIEISVLSYEKVEWSIIDIGEFINGLITKQKKLIEEKDIRISKSIKASTFNTSKDVLEIILHNVLENAMIFTARGRPSKIHIIATETDQEIIIEIKDNGQGIKEELQAQIFNMFYRGNVHSVGNGLGLYVARKAAHKLMGEISFQSFFEEGSTFKINLPK